MAEGVLSRPVVPARRRARISGITAWLTFAKAAGAATGFITGPLLARALGASGRGDLAAVAVPLALAPPILGLGITAYAFRTLPRGRRPEEVIASLGLPLVVIGLFVAALSVPAADALAGGRPTVRLGLIVVFLTMPVLLFSSLVSSCLVALERWRAVLLTTLAPFAVSFVGIVALYLGGSLTVGSAAAVTIASALLALVPGVPLLTSLDRLTFRRATARAGLKFGIKAWAGGMAQLVNLRLDQFLMITAVAPRVLGLYVVATTLSGVPTLIAGSLSQPLMTRVAEGGASLMASALRRTISISIAINLLMAALSPLIVHVVFGPEFDGAVLMAMVLLVACVPLCGCMVLSSALQADGAPVIPTIGEGIALVITVVGLALLLGPLGGVGAALVSVAAYTASLAFQVTMARRRTGGRLRDFLVPTREDAAWALSLAGATKRRLLGGA